MDSYPHESHASRDWAPVARLAFWPLLVVVCLGFGRLFAYHPTRAAVIVLIPVLAVVVTLFPRQCLLLGLATVPLAHAAVPRVGLTIADVLLAGGVAGLGMNAAMRRGRYLEPAPRLLLAALVGLVGLMIVSMAVNGAFSASAFKRMGHIVILAALVWVLASQAVSLEAAAKAMLIGLLVSGFVGLVMLAGGYSSAAEYSGRLTGLFGDPNVAGFYTVALGTIAVPFLPTRRARTLAFLALAVILGASLSRSSILAGGLVLMWVVTTRRNRLWLGVLAAIALTAVAVALPSSVKESGVFKSRAGSDSLRSALLHQQTKQVLASPLFGAGPSPQKIGVRGIKLLPHNTYLALVGEGGIFVAVLWVGTLIAMFWRLALLKPRSIALEAVFLAIFAMGFTLGEVLFATPTMIALGLAGGYILRRQREAREGAANVANVPPSLLLVPPRRDPSALAPGIG